jgi:c-di-GMP-binding flagellar brake protein YcgR
MSLSEDPADRRVHERIAQKGYIRVVVKACPGASTLEGESFQCTTRDLSLGGLKLVVHSAVPVGSMVRVFVTFNNPPATFENIARVAWSRVVTTDILQQYELGLEFSTVKSPSGHEWETMFRSRLQGAARVDVQTDSI